MHARSCITVSFELDRYACPTALCAALPGPGSPCYWPSMHDYKSENDSDSDNWDDNLAGSVLDEDEYEEDLLPPLADRRGVSRTSEGAPVIRCRSAQHVMHGSFRSVSAVGRHR